MKNQKHKGCDDSTKLNPQLCLFTVGLCSLFNHNLHSKPAYGLGVRGAQFGILWLIWYIAHFSYLLDTYDAENYLKINEERIDLLFFFFYLQSMQFIAPGCGEGQGEIICRSLKGTFSSWLAGRDIISQVHLVPEHTSVKGKQGTGKTWKGSHGLGHLSPDCVTQSPIQPDLEHF